jgi:hypothetical protein
MTLQQLMRAITVSGALVPLLVLSSCDDKPTTSQNTSEYREGVSGATSGTIKKTQEQKNDAKTTHE